MTSTTSNQPNTNNKSLINWVQEMAALCESAQEAGNDVNTLDAVAA